MTADELYELSYLDPIETHDARVAWLVTMYENADTESIRVGRDWYPLAGKLARKLARKYGFTFRQAVGILTAYSLNNSWDQNVKQAERWLSGDHRGMGTVLKACERIANGERPLDVIGHMPKLSQFYRAISGDDTAVTMDRWAARAMLGGIDPGSVKPHHHTDGWAAYTEAAHRCGESPRDFQAIIWIEIRGAAF